jgi:hypothetical protein
MEQGFRCPVPPSLSFPLRQGSPFQIYGFRSSIGRVKTLPLAAKKQNEFV